MQTLRWPVKTMISMKFQVGQKMLFFCVQWMSILIYSNLLEIYFSYFLQVLSC